jgi:hypothetical protein
MDLFKNWAAISSLAGLLLYAIGRLFTDVFYGNYGLTPEDLGINVPYLVMRILPLAAILGGLVMSIGLVAAFFSGMGAILLADTVRALEKEPNKLEAIQRTIKGLDWRIKAAFWAVVAIIVGAYVAFGILQVPSELDYFRPEARAGLFPTIWLGLGVGLMLGAYWGGREGVFGVSEEGSSGVSEEGSSEVSDDGSSVDVLYVVRLCIAVLGLLLAVGASAILESCHLRQPICTPRR